MAVISSLTLNARLTLNLHNLNNEGTEGNQQQTRMVHIIDADGSRQVVNAVSGDMFKHILVEHLIPLLHDAEQKLSAPAARHDPDRITADEQFVAYCEKGEGGRRVTESEIMSRMLTDCAATDLAGALVTRGRAVGRKSVAEIGWVVGIPDNTVTEQYFHVKYAPEGRGGAAGGTTVAGQQAIFHRPASSGEYALICNLDLWRVGLNDITREPAISANDRVVRARALLQALAAMLLKPAGAQRNTQNPHIMACEGVIATSNNSLPAPTVSPLVKDYVDQIKSARDACNRLREDTVRLYEFDSLGKAVDILADLARGLELAEVPSRG
ncbi:MAG TPA: DevR family CRISPR-associated autoregulator [Chloroflexota bacterium]|nr:DevR family CRISPR-associated autoregulator [Chloroflexota bacterium]